MNKWPTILLLIGMASSQALGSSQQKGSKNSRFAWGSGLSWLARRDYGESHFFRLYPEVIAYLYQPLFDRFHVRWGGRLSYTEDNPEMPYSLAVEETDTSILASVSFLMDGLVIPSFGVFSGLIYRKVKLKTRSPVVQTHHQIGGTEILGLLGIQIGVGIPIEKGFFVVEPFLRASFTPRVSSLSTDQRGWAWFGLEGTLEF